MNLPNKLTIVRMILIVPIIILFSIFTWYVIAFENSEFKNYVDKVYRIERGTLC